MGVIEMTQILKICIQHITFAQFIVTFAQFNHMSILCNLPVILTSIDTYLPVIYLGFGLQTLCKFVNMKFYTPHLWTI